MIGIQKVQLLCYDIRRVREYVLSSLNGHFGQYFCGDNFEVKFNGTLNIFNWSIYYVGMLEKAAFFLNFNILNDTWLIFAILNIITLGIQYQ